MKYKFRLESILKIRKFREHREKVELSQINGSIIDGRKKIKRIKSEIIDAHQQVEGIIKNKGIGKLLHFYPAYIHKKRGDIVREEASVKKLEQDLGKKTSNLAKLRGELQVVEKMKEKELKKFKYSHHKKMQSEIDDIVIASEARKRKRESGL